MKIWHDCEKDPSETGKKVLCQQKGDIYVAVRLGKYYIPMPFADHYFCSHLCFPETWSEIDFPEGLTGHFRVLVDGGELKKFSECEHEFPEIFNDLKKLLINSIGTLKPPCKK